MENYNINIKKDDYNKLRNVANYVGLEMPILEDRNSDSKKNK